MARDITLANVVVASPRPILDSLISRVDYHGCPEEPKNQLVALSRDESRFDRSPV